MPAVNPGNQEFRYRLLSFPSLIFKSNSYANGITVAKKRTAAYSNPEANITLIRTSTMANIKGIIIPVNWDRNGNVISVAIATHDEDEIIVEGKRLVAQLKTLLREEVQVSGILTQRGGKKSIKVEKFSRKRNPLKINLCQT